MAARTCVLRGCMSRQSNNLQLYRFTTKNVLREIWLAIVGDPDLSKDITKEVVSTGLIALSLICDQGQTNQAAIKELLDESRLKRMLKNETNDDTVDQHGHKLSVVFDPPHLIKGIRNNMLNKYIIFNNKIANWKNFMEVYEINFASGDIRMLKSLMDEHIIPQKNS